MTRGAKPGERRGGRAKGTANKVTEKRREIAARALSEGITPLEYMLNIMRKETPEGADAATHLQYDSLRFEAAKAAAPYVHPRLAAVEHSGGLDLNGVSDADVEAEFESIARAAGFPLAGQGNCKPQDSKASPRRPH